MHSHENIHTGSLQLNIAHAYHLSRNILWNDLYGPALANMKLSPPHMQPHTTHSGQPTEVVPSRSGVRPELWFCGLVRFTCRNMNTKLGW